MDRRNFLSLTGASIVSGIAAGQMSIALAGENVGKSRLPKIIVSEAFNPSISHWDLRVEQVMNLVSKLNLKDENLFSLPWSDMFLNSLRLKKIETVVVDYHAEDESHVVKLIDSRGIEYDVKKRPHFSAKVRIDDKESILWISNRNLRFGSEMIRPSHTFVGDTNDKIVYDGDKRVEFKNLEESKILLSSIKSEVDHLIWAISRGKSGKKIDENAYIHY